MASYEKQEGYDPGTWMPCDCCDYPGRLSLFKDMPTSAGYQDLWLCEICSQSHISKAIKCPDQCSDPKLYQSVAVIGNIILDAIRGETPND